MRPEQGIHAIIVLLLLMVSFGTAGSAFGTMAVLPPDRSTAVPVNAPADLPGIAGTGSDPVQFLTDPATGNQYVSNEIIVRYDWSRFRNRDEMQAYLNASHTKNGARVLRHFNATTLPGMQLVRLPASLSVPDAIAAYRKDPAVLWAEPDWRILPVIGSTDLQPAGSSPSPGNALVIPDDPEFSRQYHLRNTGQAILNMSGTPGADINATAAWGITRGSADVTVGIMDTGIDSEDPDLAGNIWTNPATGGHGGNFTGGTRDDRVMDTQGHGTGMARVLGAVTNNSLGTAGVAWDVRLMALKVFTTGYGDSTTTGDVIDAIQFAGENGASVVSISWVSAVDSRAVEDAIRASPALFVVAAGNSGTDNTVTPRYPAAYRLPNLITVAATDQNDALAPFSNYGNDSVDLAAPGVSIPVYACAEPGTVDPKCGYYMMDGTSVAVPQVAGIAVLVKSINPRLTNVQLRDVIRKSVQALPSLAGKTSTGGRLDAYAAVLGAAQAAETTGAVPFMLCRNTGRTSGRGLVLPCDWPR
ncbi:MAG: S8 family serine peptidase [Methanoregula sp.]|nr:S8 family serine peptidase [Methanoregula sp.]